MHPFETSEYLLESNDLDLYWIPIGQEPANTQTREFSPQHAGRTLKLRPVKSTLLRHSTKGYRTAIGGAIFMMHEDHPAHAVQAIDQINIT